MLLQKTVSKTDKILQLSKQYFSNSQYLEAGAYYIIEFFPRCWSTDRNGAEQYFSSLQL